MRNIYIWIAVLMWGTLSGQAQVTLAGPVMYRNPDFQSYAATHQRIAVLPFEASRVDVKLQTAPGKPRPVIPDLALGREVQEVMVEFLIKRCEGKASLTFMILPVAEVNARLANIPPGSTTPGPREWATILGVDAVMMGTYEAEEPFTTGVFTDGAGQSYGTPTQIATCSAHLYDGKTGTCIWGYKKTASRGMGSTSRMIIRILCRKTTRHWPYFHRRPSE